MKLKMQVSGLKELEKQLRALPKELGPKVLRSAARKAFKPVLETAKAKAPPPNRETGATGLLRDSIKIAVAMPKDAGSGKLAVGLVIATAKGGRKRDIKNEVYAAALATNGDAKAMKKARTQAWRMSAHWRWHFVEKGTSKMAARPFLRPALDQNAQAVVDDFRKTLERRIRSAVKKLAKQKAGTK